MVKPQDFTTKPKHWIDKGKENVGVYSTDPTPFLPGVVTGNQLDYSGHGTITTGQMPSGLSAHILENGITAMCEIIVLNWNGMKHYPATYRYFYEKVLPNSKPVW